MCEGDHLGRPISQRKDTQGHNGVTVSYEQRKIYTYIFLAALLRFLTRIVENNRDFSKK